MPALWQMYCREQCYITANAATAASSKCFSCMHAFGVFLKVCCLQSILCLHAACCSLEIKLLILSFLNARCMTQNVGVQNPVVTLVWLSGNLQLLAPLVSLTIETHPFCTSTFHCKPVLIVSVLYLMIAIFEILVRTEQTWNPCRFFSAPQSFRFQYFGLCVGGTVFYYSLIRVTRKLMERYDNRRLTPA